MKQKRRLTEKERNEKLKRIIRTSIPLKNDVFMIFARSKKFCQEFLRVILQDKKLVVIENRIQKVLPSIANKNVVLDMLCKLSDEKIVNVEIQLVEEKYHAKRIFTYASKIRTYELEKGAKYKDARDIIIIYLTLEDIFKKGSTVYEVNMDIVSDQGIKVNKWEAGLKVYYVNTKGLTNKNINEYLKLLTDKTTFSNKYKVTNKIKTDLYQRGGVLMSKEMMEVLDDVRLEGVEKGMQQGLHQGMVNVLVRQFKDKKISAKEGAEYLNVTVNEFLKLVN
ncbi:MAG: PD-(D/E)XK nuclease family transposase [Lachnospiraceae bacterium]|nr:PD-(D/E)XK nuclease family transposase [Lachnospiraceae bacterium]